MNFQSLSKVEDYDTFLDQAFAAAKKKASILKGSVKADREHKTQRMAVARLEVIETTLNKQLQRIIDCFPRLDDLPPFYQELIKTDLDYDAIKMALGSLSWGIKKISTFTKTYKDKLRRMPTFEQKNQTWKAYYGRISSVMKELKKPLLFLEQARKTMKEYPNIKTSVFTIAIAGFPNVGKSTLLKKMTSANPEVHHYAFTTKKLNLGYAVFEGKKVQFIDTPGTLNRFQKMNAIEQKAYLAMEHVAEAFIYIYDLTEEYPLADQEKLLKRVKLFKKPILFYVSKADILDKKVVDTFLQQKKAEVYTDVSKLITAITKIVTY